MTPEQLKASILQMAIQGKLVEQRAEEGTAEELYQQIQDEKQKLIKEGKIKKEKPLAEIVEDEITFDIPMSWRFCRLGECIDLLSGQDLPSNRYNDKSEGTVYLTGASNIDDNGQIIINRWTTTPTSIAKQGNLLLTCKGTIGKTCVLSIPEAHIARQIMAITEILVSIEYLRYFIEISISNLQSKAKSMIPGIDRDTVRGLIFPLPPIKEQHRIVAKIEEILPYVDRYAEAYEKLEQFNAKFPEDMKKSILQYAIQVKLVEQRPEEGTAEELYQQIQEEKQKLIKEGKIKKTRELPQISNEEIPYDFPDTWKVCYIDDIAFVTKLAGFEYTKYIADNLEPQGIPLFKGKNVQNGKLVLDFESFIPEKISDELSRSQITKKCLLTPYVGTIGNIAIFDGSFKAHLGSNVGKIEVLNNQKAIYVMEEYLLWYLRSTYGYSELTKYKKATAQESISIDAIRNVIIAIPPIEEQRRIVAKIEELLPYCDRLL